MSILPGPALTRPLSLPWFLTGILVGAAILWMMTAAWIEMAPASVLFYLSNMRASLSEGLLVRWKSTQLAGESALHPNGHDHEWWLQERPESQSIFYDAAITSVRRSRAIEDYYRRLLDRFTERGIPVLIAPVPVNMPTFQAIPQRIKDEYSAFLHSLSLGHRNVTVIEPIWSVWPSTSFTDKSGHFNSRGRAEITRLMDRCIATLLAPSDHRDSATCTMAHDAL